MDLLILLSIVFSASESRHYYPYHQKHFVITTTTTPSYRSRNVNDVRVVDEKTGIQYNPYSKHHPGRHVCTNTRNITHPIRTKRVFCKPTYKKYMVRCGTQWCEGVRLVFEKYNKVITSEANQTMVDYSCCPGWTQITWHSHGCNKPVCRKPCLNGGRCVQPNFCSCPLGYTGTYCEIKSITYTPPLGQCFPSCQNGGTCSTQLICICPTGYTGPNCEKDIDECKVYKPCDQICYNTPGTYNCECKETFVLQNDRQTCRKENYETALEAQDLEQQRFDRMDFRLQKLEKMMKDKAKNEVTKKDLNSIYLNIEKISHNLNNISSKLQTLVHTPKGLK